MSGKLYWCALNKIKWCYSWTRMWFQWRTEEKVWRCFRATLRNNKRLWILTFFLKCTNFHRGYTLFKMTCSDDLVKQMNQSSCGTYILLIAWGCNPHFYLSTASHFSLYKWPSGHIYLSTPSFQSLYTDHDTVSKKDHFLYFE